MCGRYKFKVEVSQENESNSSKNNVAQKSIKPLIMVQLSIFITFNIFDTFIHYIFVHVTKKQ